MCGVEEAVVKNYNFHKTSRCQLAAGLECHAKKFRLYPKGNEEPKENLKQGRGMIRYIF